MYVCLCVCACVCVCVCLCTLYPEPSEVSRAATSCFLFPGFRGHEDFPMLG